MRIFFAAMWYQQYRDKSAQRVANCSLRDLQSMECLHPWYIFVFNITLFNATCPLHIVAAFLSFLVQRLMQLHYRAPASRQVHRSIITHPSHTMPLHHHSILANPRHGSRPHATSMASQQACYTLMKMLSFEMSGQGVVAVPTFMYVSAAFLLDHFDIGLSHTSPTLLTPPSLPPPEAVIITERSSNSALKKRPQETNSLAARAFASPARPRDSRRSDTAHQWR